MKKLITAAAIAMLALPATAQTTVQPFGPGGAVIQTPGQPPTTVQRWGNTDIVQTPGQPPTTVTRWGNTAIIQTPGQPPSTVLDWTTQQGNRR